jgi:predicted N-acetyltransferase YhbS
LWVSPDKRGKGIGKLFVRNLKNNLRKSVESIEIFCPVKGAIPFYKKCGFTITSKGKLVLSLA